MNSKIPVNTKLIVVSIITVGLVAGITVAVVLNLPPLDGDNNIPSPSSETSLSSSSSTVSAQEEKSIVPLDQIVGGGPPRDGIPSIDNPKFVSVQEADEFIKDNEFVVGLNINGDIRAYPLQILVWHEIVNDNVGGVPVAVTYCPLCFTNQVFNRTLQDGNVVEFGTSGKLYNSNLVMYDRISESYWSQALAQGIVGQ
ncbi:MAG: DUF3179 domain-containing (seleno)protein, partial [Nitrososphaeraceae archaeon]